MNVSYKKVRKVMRAFPDVKVASELRDKVLLYYKMDEDTTANFKTRLRKTCWDLLNRRKQQVEAPNSAKILVFDIETAPIKTYVWRRWGQNINNAQTLNDDWPILTWSAKWLFEDDMLSDKMTPTEALERDDKRVVTSLWNLIEEADIVIAHNGLKFDMRMMNGRFFIHGIKPPSSVQVIDTLRAARRTMALPSFKLDDIATYLGKEGKIKTEMSWWTKFLEGDPEAIDRMQEYNDKDVYVLEEVYLSLRPWIKPHPNMGLFIGDDIQCCPSCGSKNLEYLDKYATYVNLFDEIRCGDCSALSRSRKSGNIRDRTQLNTSLPK